MEKEARNSELSMFRMCGNGFSSDSGSRILYGCPAYRRTYQLQGDSHAETTVAGRDLEGREYELEPNRARETFNIGHRHRLQHFNTSTLPPFLLTSILMQRQSQSSYSLHPHIVHTLLLSRTISSHKRISFTPEHFRQADVSRVSTSSSNPRPTATFIIDAIVQVALRSVRRRIATQVSHHGNPAAGTCSRWKAVCCNTYKHYQ
jgi:hypothetical protein